MGGSSSSKAQWPPRGRHGRALVIGGSFAGLWAARVLSDYFDQVTVVERDLLPHGPASRSGVPQDRHVHVLLQRGAVIMGRLFPGIEAELVAEGAHRVDLVADALAKIRGEWLQRFPSDKITYACSRVLLESIVRRRVSGLPNVELVGRAKVEALVESGGRVTGVRVHWKDRDETSIELADLVVDASGRTSKTVEWLAELGYGKVDETVIDVRLAYAGRRYRAPTDAPLQWQVMLIGQEPPQRSRAGVIYSEEHGVWMVMVAGILGDYPPTDPEGFVAFAAGVDPDLYAAIRTAEPIGEPFGYRRTENRFRHYEKMARWPERFVVIGDAVCGFNPVYGQGMTVGAMAAEALGRELARAGGQLDGFAARFQRLYPKIVAPAWLLATSADLEWLERTGTPTVGERVTRWYLPMVLDTVPADRKVQETFFEVQNLMAPATVLFRPGVALRVFRHRLRRKKPAAAPATGDASAAA
jgi:2-polyprenyl-6-methoxyphenol hydroxylase-like FAD-dependent oxidoreductase